MSHSDSTKKTADDPSKNPPQTVTLRDNTVQLYKILKFEGLVQSGAEAKQCIADGEVRVNGSVETRKRCQIRPGDRIEFEGAVLLTVRA
jgi:ribosome-associated protein